MPGPPIVVCLGDKVIVDVFNQMPTEALTIHWHGKEYSYGTVQALDGFYLQIYSFFCKYFVSSLCLPNHHFTVGMHLSLLLTMFVSYFMATNNTVNIEISLYLRARFVILCSSGEHQRNGYQYMDGTPHVTQCPIHPGARSG